MKAGEIRPDVADNDKIYADYGPDMIEHKATAKGGDQ